VFFLLPPTQKVEKLTTTIKKFCTCGEFNCAKVKKSVKGRAEGKIEAYHGTRLRRTKHQRSVYRFVFFGGCWVRLRRTIRAPGYASGVPRYSSGVPIWFFLDFRYA